MTRHAILFGIQSFEPESGLEPLKCPANDVRLLEKLFADPAFGGGSEWTETHIDITLQDAKEKLLDFLRRVNREDVAVVHFSGHGLQDAGENLYLCFTDTKKDRLQHRLWPRLYVTTTRELGNLRRGRRHQRSPLSQGLPELRCSNRWC